MDCINLAIKSAVLSPVLVNAGLLLAAPSVGCLNTHTTSYNLDMEPSTCESYGLPLPDLIHIIERRSTISSPYTSAKPSEYQMTRTEPGNFFD